MDSGAQDDQYLGLPLGRFLSLLARPDPAPSGGGAAALAVALGAALCAMTARLSARHLGAAETEALTTDTERIAAAAASLIQADADCYSRVIEARRRLRGGGGPRPADDRQRAASEGDGPLRDDVAAALSAASAVPVEIAELAVPTARAAARLAEAGNPSLRGDAVTGALLAAAGARAAAALVAINLAGEPGDSRLAHAARLADEASSLADAASSLAGAASPGNPESPPGQ